MHNLLYEIIAISYETGDMPKEFVKSLTNALPKKGTTMECSNYMEYNNYNTQCENISGNYK